MRAAVLIGLPLFASAAPVEIGEAAVPVSGLRSTSGQVLACQSCASTRLRMPTRSVESEIS